MSSFDSNDLGDAESLLDAVRDRLPGLVITEHEGNAFLFYDPDGITVPERRFPFCTVVANDLYDAASDLDRDASTYRINIGVSKDSYRARLGGAPRQPAGYDVIDTGADYAATDTVLPHPMYAPLHWVCVVNPGENTRADVSELLDEAYRRAKQKYRTEGER